MLGQKGRGLLPYQCTDVREIWYHKGLLFQKQRGNSEITNYEEQVLKQMSPKTSSKVSH